jgi:threonine dehydrogenase-like Zn-dependent dehydrogenase
MIAAVLKGGKNRRSIADLELKQVEIPEPRESEVLVQIYVCGFCQTDYKAIAGIRTIPMLEDHIVGHEPSGVVAKVGKEVREFEPGERVAVSPLYYCGECPECTKGDEFTHYCQNAEVYGGDGPKIVKNGAFAQYMVVDKKSLYKINDEITFESGALLEPTAGSWKGLHNSHFKQGDDIVVIGVGGIGMLVAGLAKHNGAQRVIAVDISDYALDMAKKLGIDITINPADVVGKKQYDRSDYGRITEAVYGTLGKNPDLVFESAGSATAAELFWDMVLYGRGVRGNVFGITTHEPIPVDCGKLHFAEPVITSSFNVSRLSLEQAMIVIEGGFDPSRIITHAYPLERIHEAFDLMGTPNRNKVIIYPNPDLYSRLK